MQAMIFAAGLGTRLKPLTTNKPKALVEISGKPLLWYAITKLINTGVTTIVINVHHFADQIIQYIDSTNFGIEIYISDESSELLDTGGGLMKARSLFNQLEPIIVLNADIMTTLNLKNVVTNHIENNNLATLVVKNRKTNRYLLFDQNMNLCGWKNVKTNELISTGSDTIKSNAFAFSGIQVLSPELFNRFKREDKFSIIQMYLSLAKQNKIKGFLDHNSEWIDVGKPEQLIKAQQHVAKFGM